MNLEEFVRKKYGSEATIEKMAGDASDRTFYRIRKGAASLILMKYTTPFKEKDLSYINIWRFLKAHSFRVPQILDIDPCSGILIMSDLGDALLQSSVLRLRKEKKLEKIRSLYQKGIEIIVDLQWEGTASLNETCFAFHRFLDKNLFQFELNYFYEHYVKGLLKRALRKDEEEELKSWFAELAEIVSGFGRTLCHRDFHSRNLLIVNNELYMTDFQDSRLGPYTYDLASFLRDCYVSHHEDFIDEMLEYYLSLIRKKANGKTPPHEKNLAFQQHPAKYDENQKEKFRKEFDFTCLQRNIKAIGTFAFQSLIKKNNYYLQYIPSTLSYIRNNIEKLSIDVPCLHSIFEMS